MAKNNDKTKYTTACAIFESIEYTFTSSLEVGPIGYQTTFQIHQLNKIQQNNSPARCVAVAENHPLTDTLLFIDLWTQYISLFKYLCFGVCYLKGEGQDRGPRSKRLKRTGKERILLTNVPGEVENIRVVCAVTFAP